MADVGVWQPRDPAIDARILVRLVDAADYLDHATLGLSADEVRELAVLMKHPRELWLPLFANESDARLVQLARFFTVAEMRLPGWEAGAHSPVIAIVAELRRRNVYPKELTAWIKAHTTNRFLPHGSLLDRL
jgi:ribosomal protein L13E